MLTKTLVTKACRGARKVRLFEEWISDGNFMARHTHVRKADSTWRPRVHKSTDIVEDDTTAADRAIEGCVSYVRSTYGFNVVREEREVRESRRSSMKCCEYRDATGKRVVQIQSRYSALVQRLESEGHTVLASTSSPCVVVFDGDTDTAILAVMGLRM